MGFPRRYFPEETCEGVAKFRAGKVRRGIVGMAAARGIAGNYGEVVGQPLQLRTPNPAVLVRTMEQDQRWPLARALVTDAQS